MMRGILKSTDTMLACSQLFSFGFVCYGTMF